MNLIYDLMWKELQEYQWIRESNGEDYWFLDRDWQVISRFINFSHRQIQEQIVEAFLTHQKEDE